MVYFEAEINRIGPGWQPLVRQLHEDIEKICPDHEVIQVKEKFGGLRYYPRLPNCSEEDRYKVYHLIGEAEKKSFLICEQCGEPGKLRQELRWVLTLCDEHLASRLEDLAAQRREMDEAIKQYKNKE